MTLTEEKILNGIKYFVLHTKNVGRTKLFKLLYFWDFMHFKRYGTSITGYDYYSFPFGPVPKRLYDEIIAGELPNYLRDNLSIINDDTYDELDEFKRFKVILRSKKVDLECFSPNVFKILEEVAYIFKEATAGQMTEISHLHNSPWETTIRLSGMLIPIDYFLSIDDETNLDKKEIEERFTLQKEFLADGRH